jgi:K+-transporting ATPase KdpF subunit
VRCADVGFLCRDRGVCIWVRPVDGREKMIENIILTVISVAVLIYLLVALIRPEMF